MLCNLVEDILNYWSDAGEYVLVMKARMAKIDSQLTTLDNTFTWKGTVGITGHGVLTGASLVDQYPITLVHIVGFKIIKNRTNILQVLGG